MEKFLKDDEGNPIKCKMHGCEEYATQVLITPGVQAIKCLKHGLSPDHWKMVKDWYEGHNVTIREIN